MDSQEAEALDALDDAIAAVRAVGEDAGRLLGVAPALYLRAHEAREAGLDDEVDQRLAAAQEESSGVVRRALVMADLAENDREFLRASTDGLVVRRVDFIENAVVADLDLRIISTPAGALIPVATRAGERTFVTIAAEIQLLGENDLPEPQAIELHQRGFDASHLHGTLNFLYGLRVARRLAWGIGMCALTDQRAVGLIFDDAVPGVARTPEVAAMPTTVVEGDRFASVIVFSARRDLFDGHEVIKALVGGASRPYINLEGDCMIALDTHQVVGAADVLVKPRKGEIVAAVERFVAGGAARAPASTPAPALAPAPATTPAPPPAPAPDSAPAPAPAAAEHDVERRPPASDSRPSGGAPRRRAGALAGAAAILLIAVAGIVFAVAGGDGGGGDRAPAAVATTAAEAEGEDVGEPTVEPAPDGLVTAEARAETLDGSAAPDRSGGDGGTGDGESGAGGTGGDATEITLGDITFDVPPGDGWSVGEERSKNEGRQLIRDLEGPDGEVVTVVHTPDFEAKPDPDLVVDTRPWDGANAEKARIAVVEGFPTDECEHRRCDDYVLNDPSFGGVAVLASDSGGAASDAARTVAASVREAGQ